MYKYAVYGNEEIKPLRVAKENGLKLDECILCPDGLEEAKNCAEVNDSIVIVSPQKECDTCGGESIEKFVYKVNLKSDEILICPYCYNSYTSIFYHSEKADIMQHVNHMLNLFESRMKNYLQGLNNDKS